MRLTLHTDYGLRALIYLATARDEWANVRSIAASLRISRPHLVKVIQSLSHAGFVETRLGRSGGVRLTRAPGAIRVGDVVRKMEPSLAPVMCLNAEASESCVIAPACGLIAPMKRATHAFLEVLDDYTIADCIRRKDALQELLTLRPRTGRSQRRSA